MKHLILPIASSPYEGAHQSAIIVDLPTRDFPDAILQVRDFDQGLRRWLYVEGDEMIDAVTGERFPLGVPIDERGIMKRWPS